MDNSASSDISERCAGSNHECGRGAGGSSEPPCVAGSLGEQPSTAAHSLRGRLLDWMRRGRLSAKRLWGLRRGRFKCRYLLFHAILPAGLLIYLFIQLSGIFIDFSYYTDVHFPCGNHSRPGFGPLDGLHRGDEQGTRQWHTVVANETYILSAFLDARVSLGARYQLRILGISTTYQDSHPPVDYCQLWYADSEIGDSVRARRFVIQEHHSLRYAPMIYSCVVPDIRRKPIYVSLSRSRCSKANNLLRVTHSELTNFGAPPSDNFTVCFSPFIHQYNQTRQLVETTEVSLLLGATRVVFYDFNSSADVRQAVAGYVAEQKAELVGWSVPVRTGDNSLDQTADIHYFGQVVALNDCFYRHLYSSRYTVVMDFDEMIVPVTQAGWNQLVQTFPDREFVIEYGAFIFRNTMFSVRKHSNNGRKRPAGPETGRRHFDGETAGGNIDCLSSTTREVRIYPAYQRSKYFVVNKKTVALGIHYPHRFVDATTYEYIVPTNVAKLHHYKKEIVGPNTTDTTLLRFSNDIAHRINRRQALRRNARTRKLHTTRSLANNKNQL